MKKCHAFLQVFRHLIMTKFGYLTSGTGSSKIHPFRLLSANKEARNLFWKEVEDDFESQITQI